LNEDRSALNRDTFWWERTAVTQRLQFCDSMLSILVAFPCRNGQAVRFRNYLPRDEELQLQREVGPIIPKFVDPVSKSPTEIDDPEVSVVASNRYFMDPVLKSPSDIDHSEASIANFGC
jgi:hypothetical protein